MDDLVERQNERRIAVREAHQRNVVWCCSAAAEECFDDCDTLLSALTAANAMVAQKSEQYIAERKAHEATRAELTAAAAREAEMAAALHKVADLLADLNHEAVHNGEAVDLDAMIAFAVSAATFRRDPMAGEHE